ncbi:hypothetical protein CORC01_09878 [Colletotrichum orchidophilum]|uniref:Uncharacterized protein n=1 Tax=Colletotrichum orchidophilum TaxID=1209926 RepID=A0A1G4B061_9PEZI|nr:uncharacterized protein CORC01_09878 [Colletotrichum orchidophilum]OHE94771.1 hypothetical protein CORC01_09878 [Colletotrichum orchidophilum]
MWRQCPYGLIVDSAPTAACLEGYSHYQEPLRCRILLVKTSSLTARYPAWPDSHEHAAYMSPGSLCFDTFPAPGAPPPRSAAERSEDERDGRRTGWCVAAAAAAAPPPPPPPNLSWEGFLYDDDDDGDDPEDPLPLPPPPAVSREYGQDRRVDRVAQAPNADAQASLTGLSGCITTLPSSGPGFQLYHQLTSPHVVSLPRLHRNGRSDKFWGIARVGGRVLNSSQGPLLLLNQTHLRP